MPLPTADPVPVESSSLAALSYEPVGSLLTVEFRTGAVYQYEAVSPSVYRDLIEAKSKGTFFNARIRDNFPFKKTPERPKTSNDLDR